MKKALGYIRISSQRQINNESPETQRTVIQSYADDNDIEIIKWYYDEAKTGKNTERAELQNLLEYAFKFKGEIDHVIVYKVNRASRDIQSYVSGIEMILKPMGISLRSATEVFDDSAIGNFLKYSLLLTGQLDNEIKSEHTRDNMRSLAHQGFWQHPPVLGYINFKIENGSGKLRPSLKKDRSAEQVKQVLERFSEGDITKAELTRYAFAIGLRSRYGKRINEDSMHRLLKQPVYAGFVCDKLTDYQLVEGRHEAIISLETFNRNQTLLYRHRPRKNEKRLIYHPDYPLKGTLRCSNCKKAMYASAPKTGGGGKSPRYHCSRSSCKGKVKSLAAKVLHDKFEQLLTKLQPSDEIIGLYRKILITESSARLGQINSKISSLRRELDDLSDKRLRIVSKFTEDLITKDEKDELSSELDQKKESLNLELARLEQIQTIRENDIDKALDVMRTVLKQWQSMDTQTKFRFQSLLFPEGVYFDPVTSRFGTQNLCSLYRYIQTKKESEETSESFLVAGVGFEPTTSWL